MLSLIINKLMWLIIKTYQACSNYFFSPASTSLMQYIPTRNIFYFPIILMNDIKQQGIFSRHSAYSLSAWPSWMCKEALGSCLRALMSLLEHCNKDYLNFLCRTEDLISLSPSTSNTGQLKIIAVLKPQFFSSHIDVGHDDHGWFMFIKNGKASGKKKWYMKHSISCFIIMNSMQHSWPWQ